MALIGQAVSEEKIFEIVDGRIDGRTPEHGYTINSPCEPNGSGEMITYYVLTVLVHFFANFPISAN